MPNLTETPSLLIDKLKVLHPDVGFETSSGVGSEYKLKGIKGQPLKPVVNLAQGHSDLPHVLAHELGHYRVDKSRIGRMLQGDTALAMSRRYGIPLSALAGTVAAQSDSPYAPYMAAAVPALTMAPTLLSEGLATHHGLNMMKRVGASSKAMGLARRDLAGAFGNYGLQAALAGGAAAAPFLMKKMFNKPQKEFEPVKTAAKDTVKPEDTKHYPSFLFNPIMRGMRRGAGAGVLLGGAAGLTLGALAPKIYTGQAKRWPAMKRVGLRLADHGATSGLIAGSIAGAGVLAKHYYDKYKDKPIEKKAVLDALCMYGLLIS